MAVDNDDEEEEEEEDLYVSKKEISNVMVEKEVFLSQLILATILVFEENEKISKYVFHELFWNIVMVLIVEMIYFAELIVVDELIVIGFHRYYKYLIIVDEKKNFQSSDDVVE